MLTGYTIAKGRMVEEKGISYQTYTIVEQSSGAKQRTSPSDLVTAFLIPELRNMEFVPILKMTEDAIDRLKDEDPSSETLSKIQFLFEVQTLIREFVKEQKVVEKTQKYFEELFRRTHPDEQFLFGEIAKNFYEKRVDQEKLKEFIKQNEGKSDCFSKCMTVETALKFWRNPEVISGSCDNRGADILCTIIRFLMSSKNSSNVERDISTMKRNCHQNRPRLKSENWHNEAFLREIRRQRQIFNDLRPRNQTEKKDKEIRKVYLNKN